MTGGAPAGERTGLVKLAWFIGIWAASVVTLAVVGGLLKWLLAS